MAVTLNPQQTNIVEWAKTGKGSANVVAYAGTGKTFTLEQLAPVITGRALFCAFNKAIATELQSRLNAYPHCEAATLHSVGLRLFKQMRKFPTVESRKVDYITRKLIPHSKKA